MKVFLLVIILGLAFSTIVPECSKCPESDTCCILRKHYGCCPFKVLKMLLVAMIIKHVVQKGINVI